MSLVKLITSRDNRNYFLTERRETGYIKVKIADDVKHNRDEGGRMKKVALFFLVFSLVCFLNGAGVLAKEAPEQSLGEKLFMKHCSKCHPDGGNVITVTKTLNPRDREANKIKTEEDIIKLMRNPGPGMVKFGEDVISQKDAKAIAEYIMKTFK